MAALTVQGGLVKNKMKGGVYNKPPIMNRVFFLLENLVYCPNKFVGTAVPTNFSELFEILRLAD